MVCPKEEIYLFVNTSLISKWSTIFYFYYLRIALHLHQNPSINVKMLYLRVGFDHKKQFDRNHVVCSVSNPAQPNQMKTREIFFLLIFIHIIMPFIRYTIRWFYDVVHMYWKIKNIRLNNILKCIKKPFEIEGNHEFAVSISIICRRKTKLTCI